LPKSKSFRILAIWVGVNLLFLILQFLKLEILLLICTSFGGAYNKIYLTLPHFQNTQLWPRTVPCIKAVKNISSSQ
jgi:hypothetical protein